MGSVKRLKIETKGLVEFILRNPKRMFEVKLLINDYWTATHFIHSYNSITLRDEGIDGEVRQVRPNEFLSNYPNSLWLIDQIV